MKSVLRATFAVRSLQSVRTPVCADRWTGFLQRMSQFSQATKPVPRSAADWRQPTRARRWLSTQAKPGRQQSVNADVSFWPGAFRQQPRGVRLANVAKAAVDRLATSAASRTKLFRKRSHRIRPLARVLSQASVEHVAKLLRNVGGPMPEILDRGRLRRAEPRQRVSAACAQAAHRASATTRTRRRTCHWQ